MNSNFTILLVEDDENDVLLMKRAFKKIFPTNPLHIARNGREAVEYLTGKGDYSDRTKFPFPELIITDIKMPGMTGLELLQWITDNKQHRVIPTVVLSSSKLETDVITAYDLGANTYLQKPSQIGGLDVMVQQIRDYWTMSIRPRSKFLNS